MQALHDVQVPISTRDKDGLGIFLREPLFLHPRVKQLKERQQK